MPDIAARMMPITFGALILSLRRDDAVSNVPEPERERERQRERERERER